MLDAFIIEEIKRQRREEQERTQRPSVQLPLPEWPDDIGDSRGKGMDDGEKPSRGVVVIDLSR